MVFIRILAHLFSYLKKSLIDLNNLPSLELVGYEKFYKHIFMINE